ncbi:phenylalanine--tRNA ligase alpha subunit-like isoform X2 [Artemia franciscana]|uniref:phenylalanine--tRNA ligase alpha subunit-like isoform X2 n=1 Tax=Artemia franciscana TaxID=6661 RepID=UPI0032DA0B4F
MSDLVEKVLKEIDKNEKTSSLVLAKQLNVDHQKVVGAIKSILSAGEVIKAEQKSDKNWELTSEGLEVASQGSHEGLVFRAIPPEGVTKDELLEIISKDKVDIGLGKAISLGWIMSDKNTGTKAPKFERKVQFIDDKVQKNLNSFQKGKELDKSVLLEYKKRKLVREVLITSYIVSKGSQFSTTLSKQETELTTDMITSGSWKEKSFKSYNFNALGATLSKGHLHPLQKVLEQYRQIFLEMGFSEMPTNNYVESSFWNFDALFQPQQHPARDAHDTFFLSEPKYGDNIPPEYMEKVERVHSTGGYGSIGYRYDWKVEEARKNVLRTHTTAVSAKMLYKLAQEPVFMPVKYFSIDRVYRNETLDATHLAEFHQIEGVVADYGLTLGDLLGVINEFFKKLGIEKLRFKPAYNPYTEPSMEVFSYHEGLKKWVEIGNSGLFRPEMLLPMGLPEGVNVIAWGLSLERPTMIKYCINNIRDLVGPRVNLEMVHENPICRIDKGDKKLHSDKDTIGDLEATFNSVWIRASQLAQELNQLRKDVGLGSLEVPTYLELTNSKPLKTLEPSIDLSSIFVSLSLTCDPDFPPIGIFKLVETISKYIPTITSVHIHSSMKNRDFRTDYIPTLDTPGYQLRITLIFKKVGRSSIVCIGNRKMSLSQADLFRLVCRIYELVTKCPVYESVNEAAFIDMWLELQDECETSREINLKGFLEEVIKRLEKFGWLINSDKSVCDVFVADYLQTRNDKYPSIVSNWIQRCM